MLLGDTEAAISRGICIRRADRYFLRDRMFRGVRVLRIAVSEGRYPAHLVFGRHFSCRAPAVPTDVRERERATSLMLSTRHTRCLTFKRCFSTGSYRLAVSHSARYRAPGSRKRLVHSTECVPATDTRMHLSIAPTRWRASDNFAAATGQRLDPIARIAAGSLESKLPEPFRAVHDRTESRFLDPGVEWRGREDNSHGASVDAAAGCPERNTIARNRRVAGDGTSPRVSITRMAYRSPHR